jgi:hypothetical protein
MPEEKKTIQRLKRRRTENTTAKEKKNKQYNG